MGMQAVGANDRCDRVQHQQYNALAPTHRKDPRRHHLQNSVHLKMRGSRQRSALSDARIHLRRYSFCVSPGCTRSFAIPNVCRQPIIDRSVARAAVVSKPGTPRAKKWLLQNRGRAVSVASPLLSNRPLNLPPQSLHLSMRLSLLQSRQHLVRPLRSSPRLRLSFFVNKSWQRNTGNRNLDRTSAGGTKTHKIGSSSIGRKRRTHGTIC